MGIIGIGGLGQMGVRLAKAMGRNLLIYPFTISSFINNFQCLIFYSVFINFTALFVRSFTDSPIFVLDRFFHDLPTKTVTVYFQNFVQYSTCFNHKLILSESKSLYVYFIVYL